MKHNDDETTKTFKGLAIAAARAKNLVESHGKAKLLAKLPRRQQDAIRQQLLEIETDVQTLLRVMTGK